MLLIMIFFSAAYFTARLRVIMSRSCHCRIDIIPFRGRCTSLAQPKGEMDDFRPATVTSGDWKKNVVTRAKDDVKVRGYIGDCCDLQETSSVLSMLESQEILKHTVGEVDYVFSDSASRFAAWHAIELLSHISSANGGSKGMTVVQ